MTKGNSKARSEKIYQNLERISSGSFVDGDENTASLVSIQGQPVRQVTDSSRLLRMKKFRFQLLHQWLIQNFLPCKAADIGGGKGLLSYLLNKDGWDVTVIDPVRQALPNKYKDIRSGARVKIDLQESVVQIKAEFKMIQAQDFNLLIGMHAHGCNVEMIDAAVKFGVSFVIFPCCVIDEPFYPTLGVHWLESLAGYATQEGLMIEPFRLNFKGQNIGLYGKAK